MTTETEKLPAVIAFLLGEGELEGVWFGDKPARVQGGYWWRSHLRAYMDAIAAAPPALSDGRQG